MELLNNLFRKKPNVQEMGPLYAQVKLVIDDVQPYARSHGGEIQLVGVSDDGVVKIRLSGACNGCPLSNVTLKSGIEDQLKATVPGVVSVVQVA